ncbi:PREDICTED: B3 [Prunus dulcis]|uniref:PREDICTED: B3 n=1 Tax=Prunus dulcis TaxID=3755 RepID=A0A5E4F930_PRUDU|nr:hypothetical protein L3X38_006817 [Prunus dulcis]VVA23021.1 PREDICTED: B3 [Prunus dulcis]
MVVLSSLAGVEEEFVDCSDAYAMDEVERLRALLENAVDEQKNFHECPFPFLVSGFRTPTSKDTGHFFIDRDRASNNVVLKLFSVKPNVQRSRGIHIVGSCNGFLCHELLSEVSNQLYIFAELLLGSPDYVSNQRVCGASNGFKYGVWIGRDIGGSVNSFGTPVKVLDPSLKEYTLRLKKWTMGGSVVYNLVSGWREIAKANKLKTSDTLQLWSFRDDSNKLGFVLIKISTTTMEVDQSGLSARTSSQNGTNSHTLSIAKVNSLKTSDDTVQCWSIKCKSRLRFALVKVSKTKVEVQQSSHGASTCSSSQNGQTGSSVSCISHDC